MEIIEKILKKQGWISIVESIVFAILGVILISRPEGIIEMFSSILGITFIIVGLVKCIDYFLSKGKYDFYNYNLIYGVIGIIIGIVTMIYSSTIASIFRIVIGIWILYSALIRLRLSLRLKELEGKIWIYSLILSILMFLCGLYIIMNKGVIIATIGILMIVYSVIDIIENVIFIQNINDVL